MLRLSGNCEARRDRLISDESVNLILNNVSGSFNSGRMACILGPSGAGKSSFLNILSGYRKSGVSGQLRIDGAILSSRQKRKLISYTPQEASLWLNLTVIESMNFAADFKLPATVTKDTKRANNRKLLEVLSLGKCSNTLVKNLSGGELKRLAIGVELVSDPKVMLLDEPTSGLDTVTSYQVLNYVQSLTFHQNRVIICVVHQPSSNLLRLFDDVLVISKGRRLYCGPLAEMVNTFGTVGLECPVSHSPADFALEVACLDHEDDRLQQLMASEEEKSLKVCTEERISVDSEDQRRYMLSNREQLSVLLKRTVRCTLRDNYNVKARTIISVLIATLTGIAFYDTGNNVAKIISNTSVLMVIMYSVFFTSAFSAILTFPLESAAFIREHKNNWYSLTPYYFSKLIVEVPALIFSTTASFLIMYFLTGQPMELIRILVLWITSILSGWVTLLLGLLLGNMYPMQTSVFLTVLIIILFSLFAGFFVTLKDMPLYLKPLTFISFVRYSLEGAVNAVYGFGRRDMECRDVFCYFTLRKFLALLGMPEIDWIYDFLGLVVWSLILHVVLYLSLLKRTKRDA
ncbi:ATP-binding cassette sub-family G member 4-like isoform X2 [Topomyia yanbarensis]|uniref:ATP-binding cassette sub-family G member 4-like isoform X2 n=1 Tax=Topomyia yanbarensis TaxID=2498891 RepID=UPI00273AECC6|nr:ATP-binding cassette sub-family G member 4-like isoform X2 [Topomyia yanbarensis]